MVNLDLMEGVIFYSFGVNDESTLSNAANFIFDALLIVVIKAVVDWRWENWIWLADDLQWLELAFFGDGNKSPVVETTFPEFSEVDANLFLNIVFRNDITLLKLMPSEEMSIVTHNWGWCTKTQKDLWAPCRQLSLLNYHIDNKMLANTSHNRSESLLQLPIDSIIEHIQ